VFSGASIQMGDCGGYAYIVLYLTRQTQPGHPSVSLLHKMQHHLRQKQKKTSHCLVTDEGLLHG